MMGNKKEILALGMKKVCVEMVKMSNKSSCAILFGETERPNNLKKVDVKKL